MTKTWLITGANRGFGLHITRAALAAGGNVVATARDVRRAAATLGEDSESLLTTRLDVTDTASITEAVEAARKRFGRIDVLVNNAGYGQLGAFEEISAASIERQFATNVFGTFAVTRAVLPLMRAQRSGHVITISSLAGITSGAGSSIYSATKFAVTGWAEGLVEEVEPFGIKVTSVHPGMFRTDFLDASSVSHGDVEIDDYRDVRVSRREQLDASNHCQLGDPEIFGKAIVQLASLENPPVRWASGSDALESFARRAGQLTSSAARYEELSRATDSVA